MRRRLPSGGGIALEVGPAEPGNTLVLTGRIEDADVELDGLADPVSERRVVRQVVVGERVDQRSERRRFDGRVHWPFELLLWRSTAPRL